MAAVIDFHDIAFGRKKHDPARVAAVRRHVMGATAPAPAELPRSDILWTPSLVRNNVAPTCTVAGLINSARTWALTHGGFDLALIVEQKLLEFFAQLARCAPTLAAISATEGLVMLDVLEAAASTGFDIGAEAPLVLSGFSAIAPTDLTALRDAIFVHGSAYVGVVLHQADVQPGAAWRGGLADAGTAVADHCILPWNYAADGAGIATWGGNIDADDAWLGSRIEEGYSLDWALALAPTA